MKRGPVVKLGEAFTTLCEIVKWTSHITCPETISAYGAWFNFCRQPEKAYIYLTAKPCILVNLEKVITTRCEELTWSSYCTCKARTGKVHRFSFFQGYISIH